MSKKILIIGNGFDLAHGLPTNYADFLAFSHEFMKLYDADGEKCSQRIPTDGFAEQNGRDAERVD